MKSDMMIACAGWPRWPGRSEPWRDLVRCAACCGTGYKGRIGVFEWLRMTEPIRALVLERAPASAIQRLAAEQGMETLRSAGLRAVFDGCTTIEEFMRHF